jgi:DNA-binding transcriptional LysR family regulator
MFAMLDVRRLLVLRAVARHGSLAAAARSLGYTQPAVSHQIHRLEQEAGLRLLARQGRGVRLTDAGRALAARAEAIAAELSAAETELAAAGRDQAGHLRIAALPSANAGLVPQALTELRARHPEIAVSLVEAGPGESWALLRRAECDLAVTFDHPILPKQPQADVAVVPLLDDRLLVILPAAHPLAGAKELTLDRLSDEPWILSTHCQAEMQLACTAAGFTPNVALITEDYYRAVPRLVAGGLGVGFATAFLSQGARPPGCRNGSGGGPAGRKAYRRPAQAPSPLAGLDLPAGGAAGGRVDVWLCHGDAAPKVGTSAEVVAALTGLIAASRRTRRRGRRGRAPAASIHQQGLGVWKKLSCFPMYPGGDRHVPGIRGPWRAQPDG